MAVFQSIHKKWLFSQAKDGAHRAPEWGAMALGAPRLLFAGQMASLTASQPRAALSAAWPHRLIKCWWLLTKVRSGTTYSCRGWLARSIFHQSRLLPCSTDVAEASGRTAYSWREHSLPGRLPPERRWLDFSLSCWTLSPPGRGTSRMCSWILGHYFQATGLVLPSLKNFSLTPLILGDGG